MCFLTKTSGEAAKPANTDLIAFKVLLKRGKQLRSPIKVSTKWKLGERKNVRNFQKKVLGYSVGRGIHCYTSVEQAIKGYRSVSRKSHKNLNLYTVRIPRGTLVYINDSQYCAKEVILERMKPIDIKN